MQKNSISQNPLFEALESKQNILIAGAGGGFDVYSGVPLFLALKAQGKNVHLANLSFSFLHNKIVEEVYSNCFKVDTNSKETAADYFPEKYLSQWLKAELGEETPVYAFQKVGVVQLKNTYQYLVNTLQIDAIVLVDGGTDSLMFGDEAGLGTPSEDFASISAVSQLEVATYMVCLGFGIDHFHGVSHYDVLANIAQLSALEAYLGSFSISNRQKEGKAFLRLVQYANQRLSSSPSIVCNSVASAIEGRFGNHHATHRTRNSELFINPLMSIYWVFELEGIAKLNKIVPLLSKTRDFEEVRFLIESYRMTIDKAKRKPIPL